ncbi:hypothetical protein LUZ60_015797 [Juncus effusus]|nr:hypothetical protein LUZ60_015797 [Juncus effusus]
MDELKTIEHGLAYSTEKQMNLQILEMEIAGRSSRIESLSLESTDSVPEEPIQQNILEFEILYGYFKSELKELDKYIVSLRQDIVDLHGSGKLESEEEDCEKSKKRLLDSLKKLQGVVHDVGNRSAKFEEILDLLMDKSRSSEGNTPQSGQLLYEGNIMNSKKQREVLHMLEKSLAREMDLETKLGEAVSTKEELTIKIHGLERESFYLENSMESLYERTFQAENSSDLLLGISKELLGKYNSMQQANLLKIMSFARQLTESKTEIGFLEEQISEMKTKSESNVEKSVELNELNLKLKNEIERGNMLEKKAKDSETQFEHAKASLEAVVEQQSMLESTMSDMEILIKDLKAKVVKTESRAELAESRSNALNETNLEQNEELGFLRGKVEMLERSLTQVNSEKLATANTIGVKAKAIANLVAKLSLERERLQIQIAKLTEKNKKMARQLKRNEGFDGLNKEASTASSTHIHVKDCTVETLSMRDANRTVSAEEESVRDIRPRMLSWNCILFSAIFVILVSFCLLYFNKQNEISMGTET